MGALQLQNRMVQAIEQNSVRRGYDPRDFTLVADGGAGPLFACEIALEVEIAARARAAVSRASSRRWACSRPTSCTSTSRRSATRCRRSTGRAAGPLRGAERPRRSEQLERDAVPEGTRLVTAARRLPLCRPGLRAARRRAARRVSTRPGSKSSGRGFHDAHEREYAHRFDAADRDHQHPRRRHRPCRASCSGPSSSTATATRRGRMTVEREVSFEVDGQPDAVCDAVLRAPSAARRQPHRRPGRDRAVRHDDGRAAGPRGDGRPLRQHRDRLHRALAGRAATRGRARDPDPDARARRRLPRDRQGDGGRALPDVLLVDHPRVGGPRRRHLRRRRPRAGESDSTPMHIGSMPKIIGLHPPARRRHRGGRRDHPQRPVPRRLALARRGVAVPIFLDGELVGFAGVTAHVLDIGGAYPGIAIDLVDIWAEAKIYRA